MDTFINLYKQRLNLQNASFSFIDHEDASVAIVYKITQFKDKELILKISTRNDDYFREVYFLEHLANKLLIPQILKVVPPEQDLHGAILMECLPGALLKKSDFNDSLAYEIGSQLARIHLNHAAGYGDPINPNDLNFDPRVHFTTKFEEGFSECSNHLSKELLDQCRQYFDIHIDLLTSIDGPCLIHRDFRPGNVIIKENKLQGIIDWASGRAGFAEEDFCPIEHGEWSFNSTSKSSFLEGYTSVRPVPDYNKVMPLLRLNRALAVVGFMIKNGTWKDKHTRVYQLNRQFIETFFSSST
jgi:Ser/Thr protein kinase RdoA (MazF antagonist)